MSGDVFLTENIFWENKKRERKRERERERERAEGDPLCDGGVEVQQLDFVPTVSSISGCIGKQTNNNHNDRYSLYYYTCRFITINGADFYYVCGLIRLWTLLHWQALQRLCARTVCVCRQEPVASLCPGPAVMIICLCYLTLASWLLYFQWHPWCWQGRQISDCR